MLRGQEARTLIRSFLSSLLPSVSHLTQRVSLSRLTSYIQLHQRRNPQETVGMAISTRAHETLDKFIVAKARLPPELEHHKVNLLPNGNFQGALSSVCEELPEEFVKCKTSTPTGNMKTMPVNVSI